MSSAPGTRGAVNGYPQQLQLFDEHDLYHSTARPGFFAMCWKRNPGDFMQQKSYPLRDLPYVVANVDRTRDTYLSQAEFSKPNRRVINLAQLGLLWVDLDVYNSEFRGEAPERTLDRVFWYCSEEGIPAPSVAMFSGRGLYLKWIFTAAIPRQALPRWLAVQKELLRLFSPYGADSNAIDASRILRLEGTVNTKSGLVCELMHPAKGCDPVLYSFDHLATELLPFTREEVAAYWEKQREKEKRRKAAQKGAQDAQQLRVIQGGGHPAHLRRFNPLKLNFDRLEDLRHVARLRGWTEGNPDGARDKFLFAGACFLAWMVAPGQLYHEGVALAREFCPGWAQTRIYSAASAVHQRAQEAAKGKRHTYKGKEADGRYTWSNEKLVELLGITPEEERSLKTIISEGEAKQRDAARDEKRRREAGAVSRGTYLLTAEQRRVAARLRHAQGESVRKIAAAIGVSVGSVAGYLKDSAGGVQSPSVCL
jgi:PAS domain-containing protein